MRRHFDTCMVLNILYDWRDLLMISCNNLGNKRGSRGAARAAKSVRWRVK